jgi:hypothetical protein
MKWNRAIKWIMLVAGLLTLTLIFVVVAPEAAMRKNFGIGIDSPAMEIVVRNWGALIALVGAMLVYGAFKPAVRPLVLTVAAVSKAVFITLMLTRGRAYLGLDIGAAVVIDSIEIVLFVLILFVSRSDAR